VGTDDTDGGLLFVGGTDNIERKRGRRRRREREGRRSTAARRVCWVREIK
jgi:hypothetical protein